MSLVFRWDMDDRLSSAIEDETGGLQLATYGLPPFIAGPSALGADARARAFNSLPTWQAGLPVQYATNRSAPVGVRAALVGSDYTFSCWFRPQNGATSNAQRIVTFDHNSADDVFGGLYLMDFARIQWFAAFWNTPSTAPSQSWNFDAWNHCVVRKHGMLVDLWLNGVEVFANEAFEPDFTGWPAAAGAFLATDHQVSEGAETAIGTRFAGGVADVRLYNEALSDAQVLALYAGNDPETVGVEAVDELPDAATDLANELIAASPVAGVALELDANVFVGPELATRAEVPDAAVFVMNGSGGAPSPYLNDADDFHRLPVSVTIRSSASDYAGAEKLARQVVHALHRSKVDGYVTCLALQSTPSYLGEDEKRRHRFAIALELWWVG